MRAPIDSLTNRSFEPMYFPMIAGPGLLLIAYYSFVASLQTPTVCELFLREAGEQWHDLSQTQDLEAVERTLERAHQLSFRLIRRWSQRLSGSDRLTDGLSHADSVTPTLEHYLEAARSIRTEHGQALLEAPEGTTTKDLQARSSERVRKNVGDYQVLFLTGEESIRAFLERWEESVRSELEGLQRKGFGILWDDIRQKLRWSPSYPEILSLRFFVELELEKLKNFPTQKMRIEIFEFNDGEGTTEVPFIYVMERDQNGHLTLLIVGEGLRENPRRFGFVGTKTYSGKTSGSTPRPRQQPLHNFQ